MAETNILVVDDEQEIADLVEIYLVSDGYKVFKATNAGEGLEILEREDYIPDADTFEVSSPGLGRPLKKEKDFARSIGKDVDIRLYQAVDKQKEFTGTLVSYDANKVTIREASGTERDFSRTDIALIRLALDF